MTIEHQIKAAKETYSHYVKLEGVKFPVMACLKPRQFGLKMRNAVTNNWHMIPDVEKQEMHWFFSDGEDERCFLKYLEYYHLDVTISR